MNFINNLFSVENKIALITGSSKGLGKAMAKALAAAGADIILTARDENILRDSIEEIERDTGKTGTYYCVDHYDLNQTQKLIERIKNKYNSVDILVNNIGTGIVKDIEDISNEEIKRIFDLNVANMILFCREFVSGMKLKKWGRILNSASLFASKGVGRRSIYSATKGAVLSFTKALAVELAPFGITVNAISGGAMKTPLMTNSWEDPIRRERFSSLSPFKRWGEPDEFMGPALLLTTNAGSFITGQNILVDGGASVA